MVSPLGKLLGTSPIAPIQEHMQLAEATVQRVCEILTASGDGDWDVVGTLYADLDDCVDRSKALRRDIRRHLPRGLLLAMPRPDLITLLDVQDRIVVDAQHIADTVALRRTAFTPSLQKPLDRYCSLLASCAAQSLAAIRELDEMLTQGFGKHEQKRMAKMLTSLEREVVRCGRQHRRFFQQICKEENNLPPVDALFYYDICAALKRLTDACGDVGEQLELLVAS
ncbi:MAG: TIGR00153 family protein [Congregibacter sp.]